MDKLSFKNYPPKFLVILLCVIIALNFGFKVFYETIWKHKSIGFYKMFSYIILSYALVLSILSIINRYFVWRWLFRLLSIPYLRGNYIGKVISSYYIDDDRAKPHIQIFCKIQIIQNINALKIEGEFYTNMELTDHSSSFESSWEEIKKKENGDFLVRYFFTNKGSQIHPDNQKYGLTTHQGVAVLTFNPSTNKLQGYYFNHERFSNGEIMLEPEK